MTLKYIHGEHVHDVGEVYPRSLKLEPLISQRGRMWGLRGTMIIEGSFYSDNPEEPLDRDGVLSKVDALDMAYEINQVDSGFVLDPEGSATGHYFTQDSEFNLTGNRVIYKDWIYKSPAELANTRSFVIGVSADFAAVESYLISFEETVEFIGNGGIDWDYRQRWEGAPEYVKYSDQTTIRAVQSGSLISFHPYPDPPTPLWPSYEQGKYRRIQRRSPHDHGHIAGDRYSHYFVSWQYRFAFPSEQTGNPNEYDY